MFLESDRADAPSLLFRIGLCYELGDRHSAAEEAYLDLAGRFPQWSPRATYRAAMALAEAGEPEVARLHLGEVVLEGEGTGWAERAAFMDGVVLVQAGHLESADLAFAAWSDRWPESALVSRAAAVRARLQAPVRHHSPALAGVMSTILPGSGQLYAGHPGDAVMAFLASAVLGAWSFTLVRYGVEDDRGGAVGGGAVGGGAVLGTLAVFTWSSNVVGAVRGAQRTNRHLLLRHTEAILREVDHPDLERTPEDVLLGDLP
ncbi:MAG: hypothetical protein JRI25_02245 [Deltaproteobacteria bacterium]|nr:hypothetical protein [Deltaproteobacteria bacterium]